MWYDFILVPIIVIGVIVSMIFVYVKIETFFKYTLPEWRSRRRIACDKCGDKVQRRNARPVLHTGTHKVMFMCTRCIADIETERIADGIHRARGIPRDPPEYERIP